MVVDRLSATLGALSDPTRRAILGRLASGPAAVGEIARPFRMSQQAVSKHLAVLRRARLVRKRRHGRLQLCSVEAAPLRQAAGWIGRFRRLWKRRLDRLGRYLEDLKRKEKIRGPKGC